MTTDANQVKLAQGGRILWDKNQNVQKKLRQFVAHLIDAVF